MAASDRALGCKPALIIPTTLRVSMPRVWYFLAGIVRSPGAIMRATRNAG